MKPDFVKLTETIFYGIFPRLDVGKGLEYIERSMPKGNKMVLVVDGQDTARMNGYTDLFVSIHVDYTKDRLIIVELT